MILMSHYSFCYTRLSTCILILVFAKLHYGDTPHEPTNCCTLGEDARLMQGLLDSVIRSSPSTIPCKGTNVASLGQAQLPIRLAAIHCLVLQTEQTHVFFIGPV